MGKENITILCVVMYLLKDTMKHNVFNANSNKCCKLNSLCQVSVTQSSIFSTLCLFYSHLFPYLEAEVETETLQTLRLFIGLNARLNKRY